MARDSMTEEQSVLDQFEHEVIRFLSRRPTREALSSFVKSWYGDDEKMNREIRARAQFILLVRRACHKYRNRH